MKTRHLIDAEHKYKLGTDLYILCVDCEKEGATGAIWFKSPFYKEACRILGIKYKYLGRVGKMKLKLDAIDTLYSHNGIDSFKDGKYYTSNQL